MSILNILINSLKCTFKLKTKMPHPILLSINDLVLNFSKPIMISK